MNDDNFKGKNEFEDTQEIHINENEFEVKDKNIIYEDNFNNENEKINSEPYINYERERNVKRLPTLGFAIILLTTSVLSGLAGAFGVHYFDKVNNTSSNVQNSTGNNISKESNLSKDSASTVNLEKNSITKIAEEVGPAVVGISTTTNSWIDAKNSESAGSGIVFDSNGYIITNQHVIAGGTKIMVSLPSGEKVEAKVVGEDARTDIAVLKVDAPNLTAAKFGDSDKTKVGENVIAIGNPLGEEFAGSVTSGILSAKDRSMSINEDNVSRTYNVMQTDASINPGSSGGALLNAAGEVIGVNTLKISSAEGMGFAIPINAVKDVANELMKNGYIKRPYLGVATVYLDEETAKMYNTESGMGVKQVVKGSAADKAGIQAGDLITEIDGKKVKTENDLTNAIGEKEVGDTMKLKINSENGKSKTVTVTLQENTEDKE